MGPRRVITDEMVESAFAALQVLIEKPPPPASRLYSRKEAFMKLRAKAREALAAGHSLETVLNDLKGVGLGMTLSSAHQYLKPGTKAARRGGKTHAGPRAVTLAETKESLVQEEHTTSKGTFRVVDDDTDI
jgi:hypothetical protein